ncbi:Whi4p KNAG_0L02390 [Huiozyma naganishii CBS 8797]|uniref:RRM domain-containing protein n=1 Tax=Huiozyma naganishii (strain ATCC MYA-139 / BCRC 22969 / CBS 8797 / KCTC 17520 / NBRC 10181 / NCYC 3082 / Yp74L-3) TaxID=1071383 RepID=J7SAL7_HUIN7|nr:hypothetical protein KNAG_0L02390 [Kazachstania naganishii CBS 8797]CCK72854.1 hypothetical protein KNAG_0L02390 [Kazachstania naganishii CBS 8797]
MLHLNSIPTHSQSETNISHANEPEITFSSPFHLANNVQNLSLGGPASEGTCYRNCMVPDMHPEQGNGSYSLIVRNLPADITHREAHLMFALANGVNSVELVRDEQSHRKTDAVGTSQSVIVAKFSSLHLSTVYATILNSKRDLFGTTSTLGLVAEIIDSVTKKGVPVPPMVQHSPRNYRLTGSLTNPALTGTPTQNANRSLQQRPSFLQQAKSRFSFSDPFTNDSSQQVNGSTQHSQHDANTSASRDTPTAAGKSLLLMENADSDINEDIWKSNILPSTFTDPPPAVSTPIMEWGNKQVGNGTAPNQINQMNTGNPGAFFLPNATKSTVQSNSVMPYELGGSMNRLANNGNRADHPDRINPSSSIPFSMGNLSMENVDVNGPESSKFMKYQTNGQLPTPQQNPIYANHNQLDVSRKKGTSINQSPMNSNSRNLTSSDASNSKAPAQPSVRKSSTGTPISITATDSDSAVASMSQADLSLLAKIPPPANPADQNPPCNTLYVGNLPSDATEQELRQLFGGQQGFRRLSFKNKNPTNVHGHGHSHGHGHGPMCFVEFEDISFATRALADLYGSQLPRTTVYSKGGIRLSFSKNPLGVRGPNTRKSVTSSN